jgi:hypothetical protein
MVGLNAGRVFAVLFLLLAAEGRLAGPFPYWADIITGVFAMPMAWLAKDARQDISTRSRHGTCSARPISCWPSPSA